MRHHLFVMVLLTFSSFGVASEAIEYRGEFNIFKSGSYAFDQEDFKKYYDKYAEREKELVLQYKSLENEKNQKGYYQLKEVIQDLDTLINMCPSSDSCSYYEEVKEELTHELRKFNPINQELLFLGYKIESAYKMKERLIQDYIDAQPTAILSISKSDKSDAYQALLTLTDGTHIQSLHSMSVIYNEKTRAFQIVFPFEDQTKIKIKTTSIYKRNGAICANGDLEIMESKQSETMYSIVQTGYFTLTQK